MIKEPELATHRGKKTGLLYMKKALNSGIIWFVFKGNRWCPVYQLTEKLIHLNPESTKNNSVIHESFDNIKELCKDADLDITVYSDGINVFDGTTETQGYMSVENVIKLSEIKKEYLKLIEDFN